MKSFFVLFLVIASGFTASGIVASLYRILARSPESDFAKIIRNGVYVIAGPTVFFGTATHALKTKEISPPLYLLALLALCYWSFAIGLFVLNVAISF